MLKKIVACGMAVMFTFSSASVVGAATNSDKLLSVARTHMGVPYVFGGQSASGFDCSGYTQYVYNKVGISIPRTTGSQATVGEAVSKSNLKPGDLIFFKNTYKRGISHVGIYVGNNNFISATSSKGVDVVSLNNSYWGPKYATARRVENFDVNALFDDLDENNEAYTAIKELVENEIINGYRDGTFKPDQPVTRGQAAALINNIIGFEASNQEPFSDVSAGHTFASQIAAMKELGIIHGFNNGLFKPDEFITHGQMAIMIKNALEVTGGNPDEMKQDGYDERASRAEFATALHDTLFQYNK